MAVNPQKTSGQNAAIQKCPQFLFDEARHYPFPLSLPGQKGLQISGNDTIKYRLFGIAGYVRPNAFTNDEVRFSGHGGRNNRVRFPPADG
jgi:hypothetical protein